MHNNNTRAHRSGIAKRALINRQETREGKEGREGAQGREEEEVCVVALLTVHVIAVDVRSFPRMRKHGSVAPHQHQREHSGLTATRHFGQRRPPLMQNWKAQAGLLMNRSKLRGRIDPSTWQSQASGGLVGWSAYHADRAT